MKQFQLILRKLPVIITAATYSSFYWLNLNIWIDTVDGIFLWWYVRTVNTIWLFACWCFIVMIVTIPSTPTIQEGCKRYCLLCKLQKPERTHHCSICRKCFLQMDHHCNFINNCVGYQNKKQFILLLFYALLSHVFTLVGTGYYYIFQFNFTWKQVLYIFLYLMNALLTFAITKYFKFQIKLLLINQTTIEDVIQSRNEKTDDYNVGAENNVKQIFGSNKLLWFFPIFTGEGCLDGHKFPIKESVIIENNLSEEPDIISKTFIDENQLSQIEQQMQNEKQKLE